MVSLRLFAMILLSLLCREIADGEPRIAWLTSCLTTLGMTLGFGLLVKSFALASLRHGTLDIARLQAGRSKIPLPAQSH